MVSKNAQIALGVSSILVFLIVVGVAMGGVTKPECNDRKDNDGDGKIDLQDAGCANRGDNDETNCGDGVCEGGETSSSCPADCGPANSCTDTDGGIVPNTVGTTSGYYNGFQYSHTDYCTDARTVKEYYCSGAAELNVQQACVYGCTNGACNPAPADSCSDTDGGYVLNVQGTVSGYQNGEPFNHLDWCTDPVNIAEGTCFGSGGTAPFFYNVSCAISNFTACLNGACA